MQIDTTLNFQSETEPLDADRYSSKLQEYHKILWSKPLPNGSTFELSKISRNRLYHKSDLGEFYLSSDRAIATFRKRKKLKNLISQIPMEKINEFINISETIGGIIIWPSNQVGGMPTINVARGFNRLISDRLDLTLECIRRYYLNQESPLYETLRRYERFFNIFEDFKGYIDFFLFQDGVSNDYSKVKVAPPFDDFESIPIPQTIKEYVQYMEFTGDLVKARNERIGRLYV